MLVGTVRMPRPRITTIEVIVRLPEKWGLAQDPRWWANKHDKSGYIDTYRRAQQRSGEQKAHGLVILSNNRTRERRLTFSGSEVVYHPGAPCVHVTAQGKTSFGRGDTVATRHGSTGLYVGCTTDGNLIITGIGEVEPGVATVQNATAVNIEYAECEAVCKLVMTDRRAAEADPGPQSVNRKLNVNPASSGDIEAVPATPAEQSARNRRRPDSPIEKDLAATPSNRGKDRRSNEESSPSEQSDLGSTRAP